MNTAPHSSDKACTNVHVMYLDIRIGKSVLRVTLASQGSEKPHNTEL